MRCSKCGANKPREEFKNNNQLYCRACETERKRKWRGENIERVRAQALAYSKTPERAARNLVRKRTRWAIKADTMIAPPIRLMPPPDCERCGAVYVILEPHHRSYDEPDSHLDVEFLCNSCHRSTM